MAKPPSAPTIYAILRAIDWRGHVELGEEDLLWLSQELSVSLNPARDSDRCEICEHIRPIVVKSAIGRICEDCLESLAEEAEESRELVEGG